MSRKAKGILFLLTSVEIILLIIYEFVDYKCLSKNNIWENDARITEGEILETSEIWDYPIRDHDSFIMTRHGIIKIRYCKSVICKYSVDNVEYIKKASYADYSQYKVLSIKKGSKIKVTYDINDPNKIILRDVNYSISMSDYFFLLLQIFFGIITFIVGVNNITNKNLESFEKAMLLKDFEQMDHIKSNKNLKKMISLIVTKIEVIDYERERVFFMDNMQNLYFYETDFGEEFQENIKYNIGLARNNKKKSKIKYDNKDVVAFQILGVEKSQFEESC